MSRPIYPSPLRVMTYLCVTLGVLLQAGSAAAQSFELDAPLERSIAQRDHFDIGRITVAGTAVGFTSCSVRAVVTGPSGSTIHEVSAACPNGSFSGEIEVPAGGWYELEAQVIDQQQVVLSSKTVMEVGVGDLYITAGQSNSANHGQSTSGFVVDDRVSAVCLSGFSENAGRCGATGSEWVTAEDPQPNATRGPSGETASPWSRLGNMLVQSEGVPIGFISVGFGGSTIAQWLTTYKPRLEAALDFAGPHGVKAILWHQGESDCNPGQTTEDDYYSRLRQLIEDSRMSRWPVPWVVAQVGLRPSNGSGSCLPAIQDGIVEAQRRVIAADPLVSHGAVTDDLLGTYRIGNHFSVAGLHQHALRWAAALAPEKAPSDAVDWANASFELPNLITPQSGADVLGCNNHPSWLRTDATGAFACTRKPAVTGLDPHYLTLGQILGLDGDQYLFLGGDPNLAGEAAGLAPASPVGSIAANTLYELTVGIGHRGATGRAFGGYTIDLVADCANGSQLLASAESSVAPGPVGAFTDVTASFHHVFDSSIVGCPLSAELTRNHGRVNGQLAYADFENVRLDVTSNATALSIANASFEMSDVPDATGGVGCGANAVRHWSYPAPPGVPCVVDPFTPSNGGDPHYQNAAPVRLHGEQYMHIDSGEADAMFSISQVVGGGATLAAGTYYQLTVAVGHRSGAGRIFGGYTLELLTDAVSGEEESVLAAISSHEPPGGPGEFTDITLLFKADFTDARLGRPLKVRLSKNYGFDTAAHMHTYVDFDNVRLIQIVPAP